MFRPIWSLSGASKIAVENFYFSANEHDAKVCTRLCAHVLLYVCSAGWVLLHVVCSNLVNYTCVCLSIYLSVCLSVCLSIYGSTALVDLGGVFRFLILYTVGRTPWTGDQPVTMPLPTHRKTSRRINAHKHPCLEWDSNPRYHCSSGRRRFMP
jgi:hypothetical protein